MNLAHSQSARKSQDDLLYPFRQPEDNFLQLSNAVFDEVMPRLKPGAWKLLCFLIRKTIGWVDEFGDRKNHDTIDIEQLVSGTGMKRDAVIEATRQLEAEGIIFVDRQKDPRLQRNLPNVYYLNRDFSVSKSEKPTRSKNEVSKSEKPTDKRKSSLLSKSKNNIVRDTLSYIQTEEIFVESFNDDYSDDGPYRFGGRD